MLVAIISKLLEKSPIKYSLVRNAVCLNPQQIVTDRKKCDVCEAVLAGF